MNATKKPAKEGAGRNGREVNQRKDSQQKP